MVKLTISQVAKSAKVNIETIKYYERRGLLSKPVRNASGYRLFTNAAVVDVLFIKKAQEVGFTLNQIKDLLMMTKEERSISRKDMLAFASAKIEEINRRIVQLEHFKSLLEQAITTPVHPAPFREQDCPVFQQIRKDVNHEQND